MDSDLTEGAAPAAAPPPGTWMRLELLGHRTRCGLVTEVEQFGAKMARIDIFRTGDAAPCLTEFYAPSAFYALGQTTQEKARTWADNSWDLRNQLPAALLPSPADDDATDTARDAEWAPVDDREAT